MMIPFQQCVLGPVIKCLLVLINIGHQVNGITPSMVKEEMSKNEIYPHIIGNIPHYPIKVEYTNGPVNFGTNFTEKEVFEVPSKVYWPVEKKMKRAKKLFSLLLYGPDVPTRENPIEKYQWVHWVVMNIPGNKWKSGQTVVEYRAWQPFYTNDIHRCIFLVFPQNARKPIIYNETLVLVDSADDLRGYFNKDIFSKKWNLGDPYAINFFQMYLNGSEDGNIWR